jgi:hypothetical protein
MKNEILSIIESLNDSPEIAHINEMKNEVKEEEVNELNNYVLVRANKGTAIHLAKLTNLVNNKYYVGCGSFNSNRMKTVMVTPLEVNLDNISCKKCKEKLNNIITSNQ